MFGRTLERIGYLRAANVLRCQGYPELAKKLEEQAREVGQRR